MGLGAEDRFGSVSRQAIRWHIGGMIGSPGDNRLIRITIQKTHDDLVPHPRQCDHAVLPAGPALAYPQPGATVLIVLAITVPGEKHLHPAIAIAIDFFAPRSGHAGYLGPIHGWSAPAQPPLLTPEVEPRDERHWSAASLH